MRGAALLAILLLLAPVADAGDRDGYLWHLPPDRSIVQGGGDVHVIVERRDRGLGQIKVLLNGEPLQRIETAAAMANGTVAHFLAPLRFGLNTIAVHLDKAGEIVAQEQREVFFFSHLSEERSPPAGFGRRPFHEEGKTWVSCRACHALDPSAQDAAPASPADSTCHSCHRRITAFKEVHGPAGTWSCLRCHDAGSTPVRYATPTPVRDLCYRCHQDMRDLFFGSRYQHGPTATGICTICHNPHASDNPFWLKKPPWYLCTTCHFEKASGRHVIAWGPSGQTHPTRGRPDPMKPNRELACNSCHNPHAANSPALWNFDARSAIELCQTCHQK
jgi:predicted CXXCH cytochrome family protein